MPSEPGKEKKKKTAAAQQSPPPDTKQEPKATKKTYKPAAPAGSSVAPEKPAKPAKRPKTEKTAKAPKPPRDAAPRNDGGIIGGAIGQGLYLLGFYAECKFVQVWRVLRVGLGFLGQFFLWAFGGIGRAIWRFLKGFFRDLFAPFHRFFVGVRNVRKVLSEEKEKGREDASKTAMKYFSSGVRTYLYLVGNLIKFLMPIAAAIVFGFTVYSVLNLEYNLSISINGQQVGVIADEATYEEARNIVRQRIVAAEDKSAQDWQPVPEYRLTGGSSLTTREQLVNAILQTYSRGYEDDDALVEDATGFEVDGTLFVTYDGGTVAEYLEQWKARYESDDVEVDFVQQVTYDLEAEDLYFASSVKTADEVIDAWTDVVQEEQTYTARGDENLSEIAHNNGLSLTTLLNYNPDLSFEAWQDEGDEDEDGDAAQTAANIADDEEEEAGEAEEDEAGGSYIPAPGTELVVQPEQRYLQVETRRIVYEEETVPFETIIEENPDRQKGSSRLLQPGLVGVQSVPYVITSIDGLEEKLPAEDLEVIVIQEPQHEIWEEGIYEFNYSTQTGNIEGSGAYIWPVPGYTYQGRGMSAGHRGADINAPANSPIYAIAEGVVIEAGWHWSWGNTILIDHGNGVTSRYAHANALYVTVGDVVGQGTNIAAIGSTGVSTGNHLHLEIELNGVLQDPYSYVSP